MLNLKNINHTETIMSNLRNSSIFALCFRSMILFKLKIIFLTLGSIYLCSMKMSSTLSVKRFWERLSVITLETNGIILMIQSSVSLFLMNFTVFIFVPGMNSLICRIILSPSYAFVRSNVSVLSAYKDYKTFSYFYGTLMLFNFFFVGLTTLSETKLSYFSVLWNALSGTITLTFLSWDSGSVFFLI